MHLTRHLLPAQTLKDAEPLGPACDYLGAKGTERHFYERLDMPDNYVVLGDALAHLNPRFGSGMTAAAFQVCDVSLFAFQWLRC